MERHVVRVACGGERKGVEKEEGEDYEDADEDAPPELLVHHFLDVLTALAEVLECEIEGVEGPDVEGGHGTGERKHDEEHK